MVTAAPTRPVLRYPGGKWQLAPWIIEHVPPHRAYVEPFLGAGSVFMQKPRAYAEILNDLNGDIVALFRLLRDPVQAAALERMLRLTPYSRAEFAEAYTETEEPLERARRLLIRSWQGFNGEGTLGKTSGWRSNSDRRGTLPAHDWAHFPDALAAFTTRLQGVILEQADALVVLARYDSADTLHYVDPPYDEDACPHFNGYGYTVDHAALAAAVHAVRGMVALSGYESPRYRALYHDWRCVTRRAYAGSGMSARRQRTECLWLNPQCENALSQMSLL